MRQVELWKIVGEEWIPQNLGGRMDYASLVDKEIRERLRECADAWDKGDLKTLLQAYDRTARRDDAQGRESIGDTLGREMAAQKKNPYRAEPSVRITKDGVEGKIQAGRELPDHNLPSRTFDTWLIANEQPALSMAFTNLPLRYIEEHPHYLDFFLTRKLTRSLVSTPRPWRPTHARVAQRPPAFFMTQD
jgi:hypothetical protein